MKKMLLIGIIASCYACSGENKEPDRQTKVFTYLLQHAFHEIIPDEAHLFVLVPEAGCHGCREDALAQLHNELSRTGKTNVTYIFSPAVDANLLLVRPHRLLVDSTGLIDQVNLPISNVAFLKTENGKVKSIVSLRLDTKDSMGYYLEH